MIKWLYPGMHVKRWLGLLMLGVIIIGLGFGYVLRELYDSITFPYFVYYLTLQFLPRYVRALLFLFLGVGAIVIAIMQLNRSLLSAFRPVGGEERPIVDILFQHRFLRRGPKVVALGGGTGLSTLLRGLKEYTGNLTAIVTVADDGGSSGRLRRELGVLPPGDFRQCIAALADSEPLMSKLMQHRFSEGSALEGHSFGNLFIVAMAAITGSFEQAIRETGRVLAVRGQILPSTLADVTLLAELEGDHLVEGESQIGHSERPIKRVFLDPPSPPGYPEAVRAILEADLLVIGPGSLYTSVLPNLLVADIKRAVAASKALKVYVCNVATQKGETDSFHVADHITALDDQIGPGLFQYVLANNKVDQSLTRNGRITPVVLDGGVNLDNELRIVLADVIDEETPFRHDSKKLAQALMRIYYDKAEPDAPPGAVREPASRLPTS